LREQRSRLQLLVLELLVLNTLVLNTLILNAANDHVRLQSISILARNADSIRTRLLSIGCTRSQKGPSWEIGEERCRRVQAARNLMIPGSLAA